MDTDSSETNLVIVTRKYRLHLFLKTYWRSIVHILTPLLLLPIAFIGHGPAYPCFFVFLVSAFYWVTDALHPCVISLIPLACYSVLSSSDIGPLSQVREVMNGIYVRNGLLDCLAIIMILIAIENSDVPKRIAIKLLITVGCSHYRLSLLLFFSSMFMSMWMSNTAACGLLMPLVKAMLQSLEKMGIIEMYQTTDKTEQKSTRHELNNSVPTNYTVFYFLGISYSCSIGGMATLHGGQPNQIFRAFCEVIFPLSPKVEFPQFMLLNLPGVLIMETLLYIWLNTYFLKMFSPRTELAMHASLTEEEARYITTLLNSQYQQLGRVNLHDVIISITILLFTAVHMAASAGATKFDARVIRTKDYFKQVKTSAPCILVVIFLFAAPTDLSFLKFFKRNSAPSSTVNVLPKTSSKSCLNWRLVKAELLGNVLFTLGSSCTTLEVLSRAGMTKEFGRFLLLFSNWPPFALALVVIIFAKILTEFASNACVVYALMPEIAKLSVASQINPHYLMLSATLASSLPCHLVTGTPTIAMVSQYVHIPTCRTMLAGVGPSVIAVLVPWFTTSVWAKAIWIDASTYPHWAHVHNFNISNDLNLINNAE